MPEKRPIKVFLCHASADKPKVRELHRYLRRRGMKPWFDEVDLLGGQDWQVEIPKALATSDAIIICLTKNSVDKEGYIQKEIKFALDKALEMPEGRIFLIPVRFEECEVPFSLRRYQWVDLFNEAGYSRMMRALKFRAAQLERAPVELPKTTAGVQGGKLSYDISADEKAKNEASKKAAGEKFKREATDEAKRKEAERQAVRKDTLQRPLSNFLDTLKSALPKSALPKAVPFFIIMGIMGILLVILFVSSWAIPKFIPSIPTASITAIEPSVPTQISTGPPATQPPSTEPATSEIGSPEHPIKVLFVPSVDTSVIVTGGEVMAQALNEATGLNFEVSVPTSYAATIEEMCASPTDTIAFIPAFGYVLANDLCGADVAFKAVRDGWSMFWTMIVVARDGDIKSLEDLNGKKWAYVDPASTTGYLFPATMLKVTGVTPSESLVTGSHPGAILAVYTGEADFATAFYIPWEPPEGAQPWKVGDDPEVPVDVSTCAPNEDKSQLLCNGYRVLDARDYIREEFPDVIQKIRILHLSPGIPNETISFGPEFPADLRARIEEALVAFAETEAWNTSIGSVDFYGWSGIEPTTDADYDFIRLMVIEGGITIESMR